MIRTNILKYDNENGSPLKIVETSMSHQTLQKTS